MGRRRIEEVSGGLGATVQLGILRSVNTLASPFNQKGVHRVAWQLGRVFDPSNSVVVRTRFGRMRVPLGDGYAVKLLDSRYRYEPEIEPVIVAAVTRGCRVIDGGANLGYWSILAANRSREAGRVVAVEPVPRLFAALQDNAGLNTGRVVCVRAALWSSGGGEVTLTSPAERHAASRVVASGQQTAGVVTAPTVTVDLLVEEHFPGDDPVLVKLDVEGSEVEALRGAGRTVHERDTVVVYEDHGHDEAHTASRYVFEHLGWKVFACTTSGLVEVGSATEVGRYKSDAIHGFNFLAFAPTSPVGEAIVAGS